MLLFWYVLLCCTFCLSMQLSLWPLFDNHFFYHMSKNEMGIFFTRPQGDISVQFKLYCRHSMLVHILKKYFAFEFHCFVYDAQLYLWYTGLEKLLRLFGLHFRSLSINSMCNSRANCSVFCLFCPSDRCLPQRAYDKFPSSWTVWSLRYVVRPILCLSISVTILFVIHCWAFNSNNIPPLLTVKQFVLHLLLARMHWKHFHYCQFFSKWPDAHWHH